MADVREILGVVDRPHFPLPGSPQLDRFKEWYHFNVLQPAGGFDLILNISFAGDITRAGGGRADVIAFLHRAGVGWQGGIDSYDASATQSAASRLDLQVAAAASLTFADGGYQLSLRLRDGSLALDATFAPLAEPMLLWNDTPLASGRLNWLIAPHLQASGVLQFGNGARLPFENACAYHDHNWGYWRWGEDFGWEWGFGAQMERAIGAGRHSLVFDRTTDRHGAASLEHTLAVWRDAGLCKVFTRQMLRARREGRFDGRIPRHPGPAQLIAGGTVQTVPRRFKVSARDGNDWLDLEYEVAAALQISVPSEFGFGLVGLNETLGEVAVRGAVKGEPVEFGGRACFEFL